MGLLDVFRRKKSVKEVKEQAKYVLKKKAKNGWIKAMELPRMMTPEELYPNLAPGFYIVHKYEKGATGFTEAGPVFEVLGEEPPERATMPRRQSPLAGLREYAEEMKGIKDDLSVFLEVFGPMAGYSKLGENEPKGLIEQLKEAREMKDTLETIFPSSTTKSEAVPISGSIPAWMVYAPEVVDRSMDNIEKRLRRWGFIEEIGLGAGGEREIIKLPEKPKALREKRAKEVTAREEGEGGVIKMPEKPVEKAEVREVKIEESKGMESEKTGGKGKGKTGK